MTELDVREYVEGVIEYPALPLDLVGVLEWRPHKWKAEEGFQLFWKGMYDNNNGHIGGIHRIDYTHTKWSWGLYKDTSEAYVGTESSKEAAAEKLIAKVREVYAITDITKPPEDPIEEPQAPEPGLPPSEPEEVPEAPTPRQTKTLPPGPLQGFSGAIQFPGHPPGVYIPGPDGCYYAQALEGFLEQWWASMNSQEPNHSQKVVLYALESLLENLKQCNPQLILENQTPILYIATETEQKKEKSDPHER